MSRAALAALLTAVVLGGVMGTWSLTSHLELEEKAEQIRAEPQALARQTAQRLARNLAHRLEQLRAREDERPFYHYQRLFHDPDGISQGLALSRSPLSQAEDPLIRRYLQVDERGRLTLPVPERDLPALESLRAAALEQLRRSAEAPRPESRQLLSPRAYVQNVQAQVLSRGAPMPEVAAPREAVVVAVGRLSWHSASLRGAPALVAFRRVVLPSGTLVQGFEIDTAGIDSWLRGSALAARFRPGAASAPGHARLPLDRALWHVAVDVAPLYPLVEGRIAELRRLRRRSLLSWGVLAALTGIFVVLQVWQAERRAAERSRFAATAAHELRTPLAGLRMYADMLAEELGDPAKTRVYARRVSDEAERLTRVVSNVLGFSRLERGALEVRPEPRDLTECVRGVLERVSPALERRGVSVEARLPDQPLLARVDRDALDCMLQNLLDNAEKYSRGAADRRVTVSLARQDGAAVLSVIDRGEGVPAGERRRLFTPFARGAHSGVAGGLGLGLAIVRALARAHGGDAAHQAPPGGGADFRVALPLVT